MKTEEQIDHAMRLAATFADDDYKPAAEPDQEFMKRVVVFTLAWVLDLPEGDTVAEMVSLLDRSWRLANSGIPVSEVAEAADRLLTTRRSYEEIQHAHDAIAAALKLDAQAEGFVLGASTRQTMSAQGNVLCWVLQHRDAQDWFQANIDRLGKVLTKAGCGPGLECHR